MKPISKAKAHSFLGGGNSSIFGNFTPKVGEMIPIWRAYFSDGLKPPTRFSLKKGLNFCRFHVELPIYLLVWRAWGNRDHSKWFPCLGSLSALAIYRVSYPLVLVLEMWWAISRDVYLLASMWRSIQIFKRQINILSGGSLFFSRICDLQRKIARIGMLVLCTATVQWFFA